MAPAVRCAALVAWVWAAALPAQDGSADVVRVPITNQRLVLADLGRALFTRLGLEPGEVDWPDRSIPVGGLRGYAAVRVLDRLLGRGIRVRLARTELSIEVDDERLEQDRRELLRRLMGVLSKVAHRDLLAREFALAVPADLPAAAPLVVLIHGLDAKPEVWDPFRAYLRGLDPPLECATFGFANDESVAAVAAELGAHLAAELARNDRPSVHLVGHSMGGLVARALVELPGEEPAVRAAAARVRSVILLGTPNRGSRLARFRTVNDWVAFLRAPHHGPLPGWLDGLGEAGHDLRPGSPFLRELNERPRAEGVAYHLVLGSGSPFDPVLVAAARERLIRGVRAPNRKEIVEDALAARLRELDEVVAGRGDGAVSLERGRLDGVEAAVVPLDHFELVRGADGPDQPVFRLVAGWLTEAGAR